MKAPCLVGLPAAGPCKVRQKAGAGHAGDQPASPTRSILSPEKGRRRGSSSGIGSEDAGGSPDPRHQLHGGLDVLLGVDQARLYLRVAEDCFRDVQAVGTQFRRTAVAELVGVPSVVTPPPP